MYSIVIFFSSFLFGGELSASTLHTEPPMSEMPLCNWVGHHHTLVWCAGFHSVLWVRWENWEVLWCVISRVSSEGCFESWDEKGMTEAMKVFHCINTEVQRKQRMTKEFKIYNKSSGWWERTVFHVCATRCGHKTTRIFRSRTNHRLNYG